MLVETVAVPPDGLEGVPVVDLLSVVGGLDPDGPPGVLGYSEPSRVVGGCPAGGGPVGHGDVGGLPHLVVHEVVHSPGVGVPGVEAICVCGDDGVFSGLVEEAGDGGGELVDEAGVEHGGVEPVDVADEGGAGVFVLASGVSVLASGVSVLASGVSVSVPGGGHL